VEAIVKDALIITLVSSGFQSDYIGWRRGTSFFVKWNYIIFN